MSSLMLALLTPTEGREAEFNRWYDEVHAAEALSTPGLRSITRYRLSGSVLFPGTAISPRYLTLYEVEGDTDDDFERVAVHLREVFLGGNETEGRHISDIRFTDLIDMSDVLAGFAVEVTPRRTKEEVLAGSAGE
jgi:hypothetical protein